jgi:hypothetical protein
MKTHRTHPCIEQRCFLGDHGDTSAGTPRGWHHGGKTTGAQRKHQKRQPGRHSYIVHAAPLPFTSLTRKCTACECVGAMTTRGAACWCFRHALVLIQPLCRRGAYVVWQENPVWTFNNDLVPNTWAEPREGETHAAYAERGSQVRTTSMVG